MNKKTNNLIFWIIICIVAVLLLAGFASALKKKGSSASGKAESGKNKVTSVTDQNKVTDHAKDSEQKPVTEKENASSVAATETSGTSKVEEITATEAGIVLDKGLVVTDIGSYTGIYMEDGTDEVLSRILMIVVTNTGEQTVQYAEVQLTDGKTTAHFTLSTLPPGESVVALEQSRMSYADGKDLTEASAVNVALFGEEPSLCEDQLKIQALDGIMNITNISGKDITGDVVIYYKNSSADMLYGGITYRVTISGGIKAGEIKQIVASHFTAAGSRVMFVTIGQ